MKKLLIGLLLLILILTMVACDGNNAGNEENQKEYKVYYLNREETKLVSQNYATAEESRDALVQELLLELGTEPEEKNLEAVIKSDIEVINVQIEEDRLNINFSETYKQMSPTTEILVRSAIVRTLTQIEGIRYITFSLNGVSLTDASGQVVGMMEGSAFIDNAGSEINAYEQATLQLYFANESGNRLVPVEKTVMYNTNISMEKLVMEQLIMGPATSGSYPTMNPDTKILNVTVKDGTCYVNLNGDFLTSLYTVNSEITIYSIVDTLTTLSSVNKVQILVEGESKVIFRESISLEPTLYRNLDLIETEE